MTATKTATKTSAKTATAKASASAAETKKQKPSAFIFGERPASITGNVEFLSVTGNPVDIECTFVYRTREEFAELWDEFGNMKVEDIPQGEFSQKKLSKHVNALHADRVLKYLLDWPLELDINRQVLMKLFDEEPAAPAAFFQAYQIVCTLGRQGNSTPQ